MNNKRIITKRVHGYTSWVQAFSGIIPVRMFLHEIPDKMENLATNKAENASLANGYFYRHTIQS